MRFIGNKELITVEIKNLLKEKGLLNKNLTFFDAFCGTGSVADSLKNQYSIIINDIMQWATLYAQGRITLDKCNFEKLGFDPFEFLNKSTEIRKGFFYQNYSPANSQRMYFSIENAGRIDFFRESIEEWKNKHRITTNEYAYLIASLIESISYVSNTAGVYGAFLKHWDPRALKPIKFSRVEAQKSKFLNIKIHNEKIENIISDVECDILYLDPPYTQNQYGTQYHLLETLVLYDNPSISPITGSRPTAPLRSDWSKNYKAHILFDKTISQTKAKYIIFSYSIDGFMSKSFIEASLKRYGKKESYTCKKISYNKYKNFKSKGLKEHFEYLFFIEKKNIKDIKYESPLNYIGSKSKIVSNIEKYYPTEIEKFFDIFGGGFNVGINANAKQVVYNDINHFVKDLVKSFYLHDTYQYILYIKRLIKKFNLEPNNSENYLKIRNYYNSLPISKRDPRLLFTVILYGFNQQIRFNSDHNFNNPVGMRWFNDKVLEKMISFSRVIKEKNINFKSVNYTELINCIDKDTFVYMDPPYRLTTGSYNDGKRGFQGWCIKTETQLLNFAEQLNKKQINFLISYVLEHKGTINEEVQKWIKKNNFKLINLEEVHKSQRKEVLIGNSTFYY